MGGMWVAQLVAGLYDMPAALSRLLFLGFYVKEQRTNAQAGFARQKEKLAQRKGSVPQHGRILQLGCK